MKKALFGFIIIFFSILYPFSGKATAFLDINKNFDIAGLSQREALCVVAKSQISQTGAQLQAVEGWCGDLIMSCAQACGISTDIIPYTGSPIDMYQGILEKGGEEVLSDIRPGDIAFYPDQGLNGHIALIVESDKAVHGNIGGGDIYETAVCLLEFAFSDNVLVVRPNYEENSKETENWDNTYAESNNQNADVISETETEHRDFYTINNSINWKIEEDTLKIWGTGPIPDYEQSVPPWYEYRHVIETIEIESDISEIGTFAFMGLKNTKSLIINTKIDRIGAYAFYACNKINSVNINGMKVEFINPGTENFLIINAQ